MGERFAQIVRSSSRMVFFGGAGVSTESGIPDFRSAEGLFSQDTGIEYPAEVVLSYSFFTSHPSEFFAYYRAHLLYPDAQPNPAHQGLARLEKEGKLAGVITQNIDGLHQEAGSVEVVELHGSAKRYYCLDCQRQYGIDFILSSVDLPTCTHCGGLVRPDVVMYEEALDTAVMSRAAAHLRTADTLIVGGTSLSVYPAAGLIDLFHGKNLVLINKEPSAADRLATLAIHAPIGEVFQTLLEDS